MYQEQEQRAQVIGWWLWTGAALLLSGGMGLVTESTGGALITLGVLGVIAALIHLAQAYRW